MVRAIVFWAVVACLIVIAIDNDDLLQQNEALKRQNDALQLQLDMVTASAEWFAELWRDQRDTSAAAADDGFDFGVGEQRTAAWMKMAPEDELVDSHFS